MQKIETETKFEIAYQEDPNVYGVLIEDPDNPGEPLLFNNNAAAEQYIAEHQELDPDKCHIFAIIIFL